MVDGWIPFHDFVSDASSCHVSVLLQFKALFGVEGTDTDL